MRRLLQFSGVAMAMVLGQALMTGQVRSAESSSSTAEKDPLGKKVDSFSLPDNHGKNHSLDEFRDSKLVVVAFLGTECPLAKVYAPRLATLANEYQSKGVQFVAVDSNLQDSLSDIATFVKTHNLTFPVLKDMNNRVADALGATRTPEVFVLDGERKIRYFGRIDDQFGFQTGAGYAKPRLEHRDLAEALDELLAGKPVSRPTAKADGCIIGRVKLEPKGDVTYSNQVSRVLQKRCQECHREGELAPFAMESYSDIVGWAEMIREVVNDNRMPPWYANPAHGKFANDARLSDEEKKLIDTWVDNGCPEGDRSQLPAPRQYARGWQMGKPDEVIQITTEPYNVPAEGTVEYKYFTVDPGWKEDKWVQATECRPGNASVVHHILCFIMEPGAIDQMRSGLGGYAPGNAVDVHPPGTATHVKAGSKLLFQLHYTPNGAATTDQSTIGIRFADPATVKQTIRGDVVGNLSLKIPAGDPNYEVRAKHKFRRDTLLLNMTPHMHLRGKDFSFVLQYPDGKSEILLDVPRWDFNWQLRYEFAEPKLVPKGSTLHCVAHFDNSPENLANPDPTQLVRFGDQTWEEMMFGFYASIDPSENLLNKTASKTAAAAAADEDSDDESTLEGENRSDSKLPK